MNKSREVSSLCTDEQIKEYLRSSLLLVERSSRRRELWSVDVLHLPGLFSQRTNAKLFIILCINDNNYSTVSLMLCCVCWFVNCNNGGEIIHAAKMTKRRETWQRLRVNPARRAPRFIAYSRLILSRIQDLFPPYIIPKIWLRFSHEADNTSKLRYYRVHWPVAPSKWWRHLISLVYESVLEFLVTSELTRSWSYNACERHDHKIHSISRLSCQTDRVRKKFASFGSPVPAAAANNKSDTSPMSVATTPWQNDTKQL